MGLKVILKHGILTILVLFLFSCGGEDDTPPCVYTPTLNTAQVSDVSETSAFLEGTINITLENCDAPENSEQGFVYATATSPTINDNRVVLNGVDISTTIENLESGTNYYVRTFLSNDYGEFYGNEVSLQTKTVNTCPEKYRRGNQCYESYFEGLEIDDNDIPQYLDNIERYIELLSHNLYTLKNPMSTIKNNGEWVIYYHIEDWKGPVTATAITNLTDQYETIANYWLEDLNVFDSEAPTQATVKVFGFVFNEGVLVDSTFYKTYGDYPIVTNWQKTDESAPWKTVYRGNGSQFKQNWYTIKDFDMLKVEGNRTDLEPTVKLLPESWEGYTHPEGVDMFYTKFWHKTTWDAVAQRQYLKLGGVISDYANGQAGNGTLDRTFVHEMGHCFFHDDIYDPVKYPDGAGLESVMNTIDEISAFDRILQRIIWEAQQQQ